MSVIVPAHDEARTIGRLLTALVGSADRSLPDLDVVVVCNGCTDNTAEVARQEAARQEAPQQQGGQGTVRVIEIPVASKVEALRTGSAAARHAQRVFLDADVVISQNGLLAMSRAMASTGALAAGPTRVLAMHGVSPVVRWYYDVWQRLPEVRRGLFGRGVVMVSEAGLHRLDLSADILSDDLAMSEAFSGNERVVVADAVVTIHPPRTVSDLLRRRIRVHLGNTQADDLGIRSASARTSVGDVLRIGLRDPRTAPKVPVFLLITLLARVGARRRQARGLADSWLRDESSRA
jgi:cellulose synthase/poly-beta-1,6-N-acetylglucosamine synthase-like glycosyltransferase